MSGYPAKQGRNQEALHGLLKRKISANESKPDFLLLSKKGSILSFYYMCSGILTVFV